jgi:hypothetical protein
MGIAYSPSLLNTKQMNKHFHLLLVSLGLLIANVSFAQVVNSLQFDGNLRKIAFSKEGCPLDYHSIAGVRWQHLQDMVRLPDANGNEYYMGTYSQNCSNTEGGLVFVATVKKGEQVGKVIWWDELNNQHEAGGYNHPGDLRRFGNMVVIAGQNWAGGKFANFTENFGADKMKQGNGGSQVLFYDVTNPAAPKYVGRLRECKLDGQSVQVTQEIDKISVTKVGDKYFLSFNGFAGGFKTCKCDQLTADGNWELVDGKPYLNGLSNIDYQWNGQTIAGAAASISPTMLMFYGLDNNGTLTEKTVAPVAGTSFGSGTTVNISALQDGRAAVVYTNVESDGHIEIEVVESTPKMMPITDLYLAYEGTEIPAGYIAAPVDLNSGAGGFDIFLCYTTDPSKGKPITGVKVILGGQPVPAGYQVFSCSSGKDLPGGLCDVNSGTGGKQLFMFYSTDPSEGAPIYMADIVIGGEDDKKSKFLRKYSGWDVLDENLNLGAGGLDLFFAFYRMVR